MRIAARPLLYQGAFDPVPLFAQGEKPAGISLDVSRRRSPPHRLRLARSTSPFFPNRVRLLFVFVSPRSPHRGFLKAVNLAPILVRMTRGAAVCLAVVLACAGVAPAEAAAAPGVTVAMISAPQLTLDSNKPCQEGPRAAYVAFRVTNTSGAVLTNLRATLGGFSNGITLGGPAGSTQAAQQYIGRLAAGANRVLYWFVNYPCTFGNAANLTVTVTDNTAGSTAGSGTVTTSSMVSAQAGGVLMSGTLGPGAVVGQVIEFDVAYEFGGSDSGDSFNLQVAGNQAFIAGCFQLLRMQAVSSGVSAIPVGDLDRPYFVSGVKQTGQGHPVTIRYFFKYLCAGVSSTARPYGNQYSGGQLKYSSNYETFVGPTLPIATEPFDVVKTANPAQLPAAGPVTFTITVTNPSSFTSAVDSIVDELPFGVRFDSLSAASGVTLLNSGSVPAAGATGVIVFRAVPGSSYVLPAGGALNLVYKATVTGGAGRYINRALASTGSVTLGNGADTVVVGTADLSVAKTGPDSIVVSDTLTYVVTTTNLGPNRAYGVVVRDSLPAGVTFVSASRGGTVLNGVVTWPALDSLSTGPGRADTVRVSAPASLTTIVNRGAATSGTYDPTAANNNGTAAGSQKSTQVITSIIVTPDGLAQPVARLPGTGYAQAYVVQHRGGAPATFDLLARVRGTSPFLAIDSIRGTGVTLPAAADSIRLPLGARTTTTYTVWYTVPAGDTALNTAVLRARSTVSAMLADSGWAQIRRAFPALTLGKTVTPNGVLTPGTDLQYEMAFSNAGGYEATAVKVVDEVPAQVLYKLGSIAQTLPGGLTATVEFSADGGTTWTYVPGTTPCAALNVPSGYDGCVNRIRWTLSGPLSAQDGSNAGTVRFVARIR